MVYNLVWETLLIPSLQGLGAPFLSHDSLVFSCFSPLLYWQYDNPFCVCVYYFMCMNTLSARYVCMCVLVPIKAKRGCQISWSWSYGQL